MVGRGLASPWARLAPAPATRASGEAEGWSEEDAAKGVVGVLDAGGAPMLVVDGGNENFNGNVDKLIDSGVLRPVLALTEIAFSNSIIGAFFGRPWSTAGCS